MKIVLTVPLEEQVPPAKYGGTELIVSHLANNYVELGHEVYLLASGDSRTKANLVPIIPKSIRSMPEEMATGTFRDYWKYAGTAKIIETINDIKPDIVHNNFAWRLIAFENLIRFPMMSTMHGPLTDFKERETYLTHSSHPFISISNNQRKALPTLNWVGTAYNGIDLDTFPHNNNLGNRDYFLFLGRTSPEKGLAEIVQMILSTPYKLKIAAKLDDVDRVYYDREIAPYVDGQQIEFLGEVGHSEKTKLLMNSKALLLWLNWEEPFGLVVPEANACGTPIIVNRRGSMPELVQDGVNGFLVNTLKEMKSRLNNLDKIDPQICRQTVVEKFSTKTMCNTYLKLAEKVIDASLK